MFHKVKEVKAIEDFKLQVCFDDKTVKIYDVVPLFNKWNVFEALRDNNDLFCSVKVDVGGYGVRWNEEIDLFAMNFGKMESLQSIKLLFKNFSLTMKALVNAKKLVQVGLLEKNCKRKS